MRVEDAEQGIGELRELIVELAANPTRQERERFDQPLDVRVVAPCSFQQEPSGRVRILESELLGVTKDIRQLLLIISVQFVVHCGSDQWSRAPESLNLRP
jgi:hypothetical protein